MKKKKILVTGGDGRFAKVLSKYNSKLNLYFASKKECNILNIKFIAFCEFYSKAECVKAVGDFQIIYWCYS